MEETTIDEEMTIDNAWKSLVDYLNLPEDSEKFAKKILGGVYIDGYKAGQED